MVKEKLITAIDEQIENGTGITLNLSVNDQIDISVELMPDMVEDGGDFVHIFKENDVLSIGVDSLEYEEETKVFYSEKDGCTFSIEM